MNGPRLSDQALADTERIFETARLGRLFAELIERRAADKHVLELTAAAIPFARVNGSDESIIRALNTSDITRLRRALSVMDAP